MGNINTSIGAYSQQTTVSNTVLSLVDFGFTDAEILNSSSCTISVNTNSVRLDWSGNAPTVSVGAKVTGIFSLQGNENLYQLQLIRDGATDSEVFIVLES